MAKTQDQAWMEAANRACVESHKLLLQVKRTLRAHESMHNAAHKCVEAQFDQKHADNPLVALMQAMGLGMELSDTAQEASYRDGMAHLRISQAVDLLTDLGCLRSPDGQEESLAAMKAAQLQKHGIDLDERLNAAMTEVSQQDKDDLDG